MSQASREREAARRLQKVRDDRAKQFVDMAAHYRSHYTPSFLAAGVAIAEIRFDDGHSTSTPEPQRLCDVPYWIYPPELAEAQAFLSTVVEDERISQINA